METLKQGTLDLLVKKPKGLIVFTRENLLHAMTQFVAVNDQVRLTLTFFQISPYYEPVACSRKQDNVLKLFGCDET